MGDGEGREGGGAIGIGSEVLVGPWRRLVDVVAVVVHGEERGEDG